MDLPGVIQTAFVRGFYLAVLAGAGAAVGILSENGSARAAILAFLGAFIFTLSGRGLGEGLYDRNRNNHQPPAPPPTVQGWPPGGTG
jgi:hypothetical protein